MQWQTTPWPVYLPFSQMQNAKTEDIPRLDFLDDPIIGQVDYIIDTAALASSVVIDQTEVDHQGRLMEGYSHNEDIILPPPSKPKVGDSEIHHVASASSVGAIHGVSDGQQPEQADLITSSVVNGENDVILPSAYSHDVKLSEFTLPLPEVGTIDVQSSQNTTDEQKSENALSASIGSESNNQIKSPNDSTQPLLVGPGSVDGLVKDTLDGQQNQGADSLGSSQVQLNGTISSSPKVNNVSHLVIPYKKIVSSMVESPKPGNLIPKKGDLNRGCIVTASPFESVKDAGSKFGGMVRWKSQRTQTLEGGSKAVAQDLENLQEQMVVYKKQSVDAEVEKIEVLKELDNTNKLIKELKLSLDRAQTDENQAKQDSELAKIRAEEMEQGICNEASVAAEQKLEVAKARHAAAVELKSVNEELEMS
ncbi:protein WEAK CHLOROPLAST MOVEMENT UNDER BLUE LIGHT 1-like [Hibiscus syriacus]|uniref:protein WEAK CHLOROPLAST MOVEMENT UNDER BLUE LIGHT 1-like n=1 Tax=Hibiscus syriacus TaxID=106335 RepID=UPI0019209814|nr:protein WEAK CHLOROPLAST MOVEMENT UNDER BLUE LIGHT 1-like [Hibiscus syriacus]